ncbi:5-oxoprolinase subunit PxpB [Herbaspirillum lusitanum]|uniref:5-oxoprolinase subunit PxpB n=1 Tax=Herbaspirillum lusitanum TaxID=213312 RepID=UPI0002F95DB1|nr:5-oxoprolinase subunit PxpB [Herbaspirillum lusitanum]
MSSAFQQPDAVLWQILPSGDNCLVIVAQDGNPDTYSAWAAAAANQLRTAKIPGVIEVVPAMRTVGVHYQPARLRPLSYASEIPYQTLLRLVNAQMQEFRMDGRMDFRVVNIPVCYGGEHGPDLDSVARTCGLEISKLIELHSTAQVSVQMVGFAPGHPYIGTFDQRLSPPRREQPRTTVPAGSIGLANRQTVIYPFELPGGWNLIGRTPLKLFDPVRQPSCLLQAGDRIRFIPIAAEEFVAMGGAQ